MQRARRLLAALALTIVVIGGSLVVAGPAAAVPGCEPGFICFYDQTNYVSKIALKYETHDFINCTAQLLPSGDRNRVASVFNNSFAHLELWDIDSHPSSLLGTALKGKAYGSLGAGNDRLDWIIGVGCI
jgi:hypothetical protein